jgi:hypothetical protein
MRKRFVYWQEPCQPSEWQLLVVLQRSPSGQTQFPTLQPVQFESHSGRLAQRPPVQTFKQQSLATLQGAPSPWQAAQCCVPSHPRPTQQPPPPPVQLAPRWPQPKHCWLQTALQHWLEFWQSVPPEAQLPWMQRFAPLQERLPVQVAGSQAQAPWMHRSPWAHATAHPASPEPGPASSGAQN